MRQRNELLETCYLHWLVLCVFFFSNWIRSVCVLFLFHLLFIWNCDSICFFFLWSVYCVVILVWVPRYTQFILYAFIFYFKRSNKNAQFARHKKTHRKKNIVIIYLWLFIYMNNDIKTFTFNLHVHFSGCLYNANVVHMRHDIWYFV